MTNQHTDDPELDIGRLVGGPATFSDLSTAIGWAMEGGVTWLTMHGERQAMIAPVPPEPAGKRNKPDG